MKKTINGKLGQKFEFARPGASYVYVEIDGGPARQICKGGGLVGSTIQFYGGQTEFDRVCANWHRAHRKNHIDSNT